MSSISLHVGQRIKMLRKSKGLTLDEFALLINKSKATTSKYENGNICMDLDTLLEIADALETNVSTLVEYRSGKSKSVQLPKNIYFDSPNAYMYYYDGRTRKIIRALMCFSENHDDKDTMSVSMYHGIDSFDVPEKCQHIFTGFVHSYDTISHIMMTNQINPAEKMYVCVLNPLHANSSAVGILSGLGSNPFFAPISIKTLISKTILEENEDFMNVITLSKEDLRLCKHYNMMVINRPNSLFLKKRP